MSLQRKHILPAERCWQEAKMSGDTPGVGWGRVGGKGILGFKEHTQGHKI